MRTDDTMYATDQLAMAIFLYASNSLKFLRIEEIRRGKLRFVFADPDRKSTELEFAFESGSAVSVIATLAAQKYLRRAMNDVLGTPAQHRGQYETKNAAVSHTAR
jgi:hypothetical protein